jgi:hypothetical protein
MAISEHDRFKLHGDLERVVGAESADTMMEHLPPVGWADVATKQDLEHQRVLLSKDVANTQERFSKELSEGLRGLEAKMDRHFQIEVGILVTVLVAVIGAFASLG